MANIPTIHNRISQTSKPVRRSHKVTQSEHSKEQEQPQGDSKERRRGERRKQRIHVALERRGRQSNRRHIRRATASNERKKHEGTGRIGRHINIEA